MSERTTNESQPADTERGLVTDAATLPGPSAAVALDHYLNRPPKHEPPKIELPPGVKKD